MARSIPGGGGEAPPPVQADRQEGALPGGAPGEGVGGSVPRPRVEALRRLPLWEAFTDELLGVVADAMETVSFGPGETIIRRGEPGRAFSVLISGRADVRIAGQAGAVVTVATMKPGDSFGEMSLLSEEVTSADVVAVERCETLALGREPFRDLISRHPVLLREFVRLLSQRVKASDVSIGVARQKEEHLTRFLRDQRSEPHAVLVGKSKPAAELQRQIAARSQVRTPLLIRGEKGAGKELAARLVHLRGPWNDAPLIVVDCGQITESQWGDQLLGLNDQDASASARGLSYLALAEGGTIVLKNVQAIPPAIQQRLVRILGGEPLAGGARPYVRLIVTCRTNLLEETVAGRFSAELASLLLADVLEVPSLREHKRDIPDLAAYFARRHAERQGKPVPALEDHAVSRLVAYDYAYANARELEEAIERAVIISDGATIPPEAIFLGPPPREGPGGFNLLGLPKPLVAAALRFFPGGVRAGAALVFAFVLYACFALEAGPRGNIGTVLAWSVWWPLVMLSFFFAGRAWCAVCPMGAPGTLAQRLLKRWARPDRRVPEWLKENDASLVMGGFFLIVWTEELSGMRHSPVATGLLLLSIIAGALVTSALLPRRAWCLHLCPLGGLAGLCSTSSILELRPTPDLCAAKCKGHTCYKGDENGDGCPTFQHVMFVESNRDCVLCLKCVRLCPNGSPRLNLRFPARELWTGAAARPGTGRFVVLLLGLLAGQALIQYWESNRPAWAWMRSALEGHRSLALTAILLLAALLPLGLHRLAERRSDRDPDPVTRGLLWRRVTSWAPLVVAGYVAYQFGNVPGFDRLQATLGGLSRPGLADPLLAVRILPATQALVLAAGLALTAVALRKTWPPEREKSGIGWFRGQAFSLGAATAYAGALLLVLALRPSWMGI